MIYLYAIITNMFQCVSNYFSYYYNYYFNNSNNSNSIHIKDYKLETNNSLNKNNNKEKTMNNFSMLEIQDSYKLIFSQDDISEDIPKMIEIVLYKYYNNDIISTNETSLTFVHSNKFLKINSRLNSKLNIKTYLDVINIIRNYNIKNIVLPEHIYSNNYKKSEYIEIFPFYPHGDLYYYFTENTLDISEIINIYKQMVDIVCDYHSINLVHRDLKLENFIISYDDQNNMQVKLIDLDFSTTNYSKEEFRGGTLQYTSYEIINYKTINNWNSCDIWALNVILYILLFNYFPWSNSLINDNSDNYDNIKPCKLFNYYLQYNDTDYWEKQLDILYLSIQEKKIFNMIFRYGFNINYKERSEIKYIQSLLKQI